MKNRSVGMGFSTACVGAGTFESARKAMPPAIKRTNENRSNLAMTDICEKKEYKLFSLYFSMLQAVK